MRGRDFIEALNEITPPPEVEYLCRVLEIIEQMVDDCHDADESAEIGEELARVRLHYDRKPRR